MLAFTDIDWSHSSKPEKDFIPYVICSKVYTLSFSTPAKWKKSQKGVVDNLIYAVDGVQYIHM